MKLTAMGILARTMMINVLAFAGLSSIGVASAGEIVAIVEEIESVNAKLPYMDGVTPGTVIDLARNERLVLGYLASCIDETITGGSVVVGTTQSVVNGGTVSR